ncbi:MAG TPA: carboxypeptidase-like regulatory domain-containing protein [Pyrinomonadaceae bacterium]|nr:carboxypeptidase-like regulatory domain-containing protein [Pyrinomonadaceae bacterium]
MRLPLPLYYLSAAVLFLFILPETASACSCVRSGSVEEAFAKAGNVVVLKLQAVERYADGETGYGYGGVKQSKLMVEQSLKGNLKVGQVLTFGQGGGADCVWTFSEEGIGNEYLFYLGPSPPKPGMWAGFTCSRSGNVEYRGLDLRYIKERSKRLGQTRVSGTVSKRIDSPIEGGRDEEVSLPNMKVFISGGGRKYEATTDENGDYEIYGIPPGSYSVTTENVPGYSFWNDQKSYPITLKAGETAEQQLEFVISNRIRGVFRDTSGRPLNNVCLRLRPASGKEASGFFEMDCTNAKGEFEIDEIPEGTYVLVINEDDTITADQPFRKFYYPAAATREQALEITIGPGQNLDDLIITAPSTTETITISGRLLLADRKPATDKNTKWVTIEYFDDAEKQDDTEYPDATSTAKIKSDGTFMIRILRGGKGRLAASMNTFEGMYTNCPAIDRIIKARKEKIGLLKVISNSIRVDATSDLVGQEFIFPFPSTCRKDIED